MNNTDFRVLLVTSNELFASTVSCVLQDRGLVLLLCEDLAGLERALRMGPLPDAVVIDQEASGDVRSSLREVLSSRPVWANLPFLVIGDVPAEGYAALRSAAAVVGFLPRPFHPCRILEWLVEHQELFGGKAIPDGTGTLWRRWKHEDPSLGLLVLDDDPVARGFLEDALGPLELPLEIAQDWMSFRDRVFRRPYAAMVVDIRLPGFQGDELARFAQSFLEEPRPRIVLHSVLPAEEQRRLARDCGATNFLVKGTTPGEVLRVVEAAVEDYRRASGPPAA